jgi:hypothetical protein
LTLDGGVFEVMATGGNSNLENLMKETTEFVGNNPQGSLSEF